MRIGLIWAQAHRGAIGRRGTMPWHLPEDLAHFRSVTSGAPVIMGRRTWESLPERFRPLPGRANFVVSRDRTYVASGAVVAPSLEAALAKIAGGAESVDRVWIIGGGELYRAAMPIASELVVTRIDLEVPDADTHAPEIGAEWRRIEKTAREHGADGLGYYFERWERDSTRTSVSPPVGTAQRIR